MATTITNPVASSTLGGTFNVEATCNDLGITGITFFVDGVQIGSKDTTSPYARVFDSTTVRDGSHNFRADCASLGNTSNNVVSFVNNYVNQQIVTTNNYYTPAVVYPGLSAGAKLGIGISGVLAVLIIIAFYRMYKPRSRRS